MVEPMLWPKNAKGLSRCEASAWLAALITGTISLSRGSLMRTPRPGNCNGTTLMPGPSAACQLRKMASDPPAYGQQNSLMAARGFSERGVIQLLSSAIYGRLSLLPRSLFHFLSEAERSHVSPDLFDVGQAFFFGARFSGVLPTQRVFLMGRPDGVLFFVIEDYFVDSFIFTLVVHDECSWA